MNAEAEIAVVGAGLAGLAAARSAVAAGAPTIVLEARDRVGGRVLGAQVGGGETAEIGGQFVGPGQDRVLALLDELGIETFPTYDEGRSLLEIGGRRRRYRGTVPRVGPLVLLDIARARMRLNRMARRVDPQAPWTAPGAEELDGMTVADWLGRAMRTEAGRALMRIAGRTIWGAEPEDMSLLHALFYLRSAGGLDPVLDVEGGAQEGNVVGGAHRLALALAAGLGERVRLGSPAVAISHGGAGVEVEVGGGSTLRARRAIVAVPAPLRGRIEFRPALPDRHRAVGEAVTFGRLMKCLAVYPEPFWRADGLSGEAVSDAGPATLTFDATPPSGKPGVLLGFVGGADAHRASRLDPEARRDEVLGGLVRLFGAGAAGPERYIEQDWGTEEWSGGGPTFAMAPGAWRAAGPGLRQPVGPIHWAGTETATRWAGYMDGAIRSGERAAAEALAALGEGRGG